MLDMFADDQRVDGMTTRRILLRITTISLLMALLAVGGLLAQPTPPIIVSNNTTTTFTFDDGADPSVWFSGTYAIVQQTEGGYGMVIALDDAPVTLSRPLLDGETLAVTLRRGVGRAGVRLVSETTAYTVWIETSGIAVLERDGAEQGRVPVAGDAQRVTLTYASGTLTASVGAYAFPPISDGTAFTSLRAEFVVQGGNGQGSTFDDVTVPLPPGLVMNLPQPTLVPTALTSEELGFQLLSEAAPTSSLAVIPDELSFTFDDGLDPFQWFSGEFGMIWTADAGYQLAITADTAPVTLLRPIQADHTISATVRPGTGEAGLRYAGAADEYTLWVSATGAARLQRNGVDVGQTALDTNTEYQLSMRYSAGVLYASLNDYDFPVISDPDPLTLWRLELMIAGGAGVGSTFDNITVTAPAAELLGANTQSLSTAIGGQPRLFREALGGTTLPQGYYGGILPQATSHTLFGTQNRVVQTVRADGSLATLTIQPSSTHEVATSGDIAVSPDGQRLAVECTGYGSFGGGYSICIVDLLPTPRIIYAMTMPQGYTLNPTWLSDSLIAFSAFGSLGSTSEIYAVGATAAAFYGRIANCLYPQGSVSTVFCVNLTSNYPLYAAQLANVQPNGWIPAQPVASSPQHIAAFAVMAAANGQFTLGAATGTTCSNGTDPGPNSNDCQIGLWTLSAQTGSWTAAAIPAYQSALTFNGYRQNISEVEFSEGQSKLLISRFTAAGEIPSPQHQAYVWEWKAAPANEFTKISTDVAGLYVNYGWSLSQTFAQVSQTGCQVELNPARQVFLYQTPLDALRNTTTGLRSPVPVTTTPDNRITIFERSAINPNIVFGTILFSGQLQSGYLDSGGGNVAQDFGCLDLVVRDHGPDDPGILVVSEDSMYAGIDGEFTPTASSSWTAFEQQQIALAYEEVAQAFLTVTTLTSSPATPTPVRPLDVFNHVYGSVPPNYPRFVLFARGDSTSDSPWRVPAPSPGLCDANLNNGNNPCIPDITVRYVIPGSSPQHSETLLYEDINQGNCKSFLAATVVVIDPANPQQQIPVFRPSAVVCNGDLLNSVPNTDQPVSLAVGQASQHTFVHELGHIFDYLTIPQGQQLGLVTDSLDGAGSRVLSAPGSFVLGGCASIDTENRPSTVMGVFNGDWSRGRRGWGSAPPFSRFLQSPENDSPLEAAADIFLNWIYRTNRNGASQINGYSVNTETAPTGGCIPLGDQIPATVIPETWVDGGFFNRAPADDQSIASAPFDWALSGDIRHALMNDLMSAIFSAQGW